jgi:hypothetical protein
MKGKLVKLKDGYNLFIDQPLGRLLEATCSISELKRLEENNVSIKKLSLKNCEAIADGYNLDELTREACDITDPLRLDSQKYKQDPYFKIGFNKGFKKALEILGDKKFSEEELTMLFAYGHQIGMNDILAIQSQHSPQPMPKPDSDKLRDELIQSLQKTEWDVEIEMTKDWYDGFKPIPKLDTNDCLILKHK